MDKEKYISSLIKTVSAVFVGASLVTSISSEFKDGIKIVEQRQRLPKTEAQATNPVDRLKRDITRDI